MMPNRFWYWLWAVQATVMGIVWLAAIRVGSGMTSAWLGGFVAFSAGWVLFLFEENYRGMGR